MQIVSVVVNISGEGVLETSLTNFGILTLPSLITETTYSSLGDPNICLAILNANVTPNVWICVDNNINIVNLTNGTLQEFLFKGQFSNYGIYAFILDICPGPLCGNTISKS